MLSPERFPLRPEALAAPSSGIVEVFDYGRNRPGLLPLWVGEGDRATPSFIIEAASRSLAAGETFYTHQAGIPPLREAIAAYLTRISGQKVGAERIFVTNGGMHALQIAVRMTSWDCATPQLTATISVAIPASFNRVASSIAISSNGFIDILTLAISTSDWSGLTRTFTV